jgi:hypothetical protein
LPKKGAAAVFREPPEEKGSLGRAREKETKNSKGGRGLGGLWFFLENMEMRAVVDDRGMGEWLETSCFGKGRGRGGLKNGGEGWRLRESGFLF